MLLRLFLQYLYCAQPNDLHRFPKGAVITWHTMLEDCVRQCNFLDLPFALK